MAAGEAFPPRQVTLLLCTSDGRRLGALPPFEVEVPWWPEAEPVVAGARDRFGVEVTVLRLVAAPESERAAAETLALPIYSELDETQQQYVVETIAAFYAKA